MDLLTVVGIAIGLAMDAFAVAIATSVRLHPVTGHQVFRYSFHFGLFQALMPVLGWLAGSTIVEFVRAWDHWLVLALLGYVGGKMLMEAFGRGDDEGAPVQDPTRGWSLIINSVATSIDAFAVGLSFAWLQVSVWYPAAVIGVITAAITLVGMQLGSRLGQRFGRIMEVVGGLVLIGIGVRIVIEHLSA
ncbi:MAG: manganese efflux pump MntP family protein [Pseudomonadota bacterium]